MLLKAGRHRGEVNIPTRTTSIEAGQKLIDYLKANGATPTVTFQNGLAFFEFPDEKSFALVKAYLKLDAA